MKNGIPCNESHIIAPADQNRITYTFVRGDEEIPSSCTISLGDIDPMTGEPLSDLTFFRAYHSVHNSQARYNTEASRVSYTDEEKDARKAEREQIAHEFEEEYGYTPSKGTVRYLQEQRWPSRYHASLDHMINEEGESFADCIPEIADPRAEAAFPDRTDDQTERLQAFAATLSGRLRDVYELMLAEVAGCCHISGVELGEKWGVTKHAISKDRKKIEGMIREWMGKEKP